MAAKTKKSTTKKSSVQKSPKPRRKTKQTFWGDDLGIGYATYDHEEDYVSKSDLDEDQRDIIKNFHQRLALSPILVDEDY